MQRVGGFRVLSPNPDRVRSPWRDARGRFSAPGATGVAFLRLQMRYELPLSSDPRLGTPAIGTEYRHTRHEQRVSRNVKLTITFAPERALGVDERAIKSLRTHCD
jgi:hypothetical protein